MIFCFCLTHLRHGILDESGVEQGHWEDYYESGQIKAEGAQPAVETPGRGHWAAGGGGR